MQKTFRLTLSLAALLLASSASASVPETTSVATARPAEVSGMAPDGSAGNAVLAFPTITNQRTAKSVPSSSCTPVPAAASTFSSTDAYVYLFFNISGQANGEQLTRVWYSPDGEVAATGQWNAMSSGGGYCPWAGLQIAGTSVASRPGTWRVRVYSNMIFDVPYVDLTFTITSGGGGGPTLPTVTNAMTARSIPSDLCGSLPTPANAFLSTDASVYLYFRISGFQSNEGLTAVWWDPAGQVHASHPWDPLSTAYSGYCLADRLDIAGTSAASKPGTWRVQVFSDKLTDVPYVDLTFSITSSGGGGTVAGTWLLTSSARISGGGGAFWQTDLSIRNTGSTSASVTVKFLGHSGDGRSGPERYATIPAGQTQTWRDVLWTLFGLSTEYGPILVRSTSTSLAVLGQTWTAGGGGTYGQSVPVLSTGELVGTTPRSILGVRQDTYFRTNLMLANATESTISVTVQLVSISGSVLGTKGFSIGPLSRAQFNVATDFGYTNLADGAFVVSSSAASSLGAYASVIDNATLDPRTLLPR